MLWGWGGQKPEPVPDWALSFILRTFLWALPFRPRQRFLMLEPRVCLAAWVSMEQGCPLLGLQSSSLRWGCRREGGRAEERSEEDEEPGGHLRFCSSSACL